MDTLWTEIGWSDYEYWQEQDKKTLKRINRLIKDIKRNGYTGLGKPKPLKDSFQCYWSRRIDDTNRLVYKIEENTLIIVQCRSHYHDK